MVEPDPYILALHLVSGVGAVTYRRLVARFGSAEAVVRAPRERLARVPGLGHRRLENILRLRAQAEERAREELRRASELGVHIVDLTQPAYPAALKSIFDPPLVVYVRGTLRPDDALALAVVGTRRPSLYGQQTAGRLARELAGRGFTVVSGLARGIDTAAHRGALEAGGRTVGVMGSGLDVPYPRENQRLMEEIASRGALVSELPLGTRPDRQTFPRRNRLISGLSLGVIVVEGKENSGALITARTAVEQGREVFAVPGRIDDPRSRGPHLLIKQGAKLVASVEDVLAELGPMADFLRPPGGDERGGGEAREREAGTPPGPAPVPVPVPAAERAILEVLGEEPVSVEDIIAETGLSPQEVASRLLVLEIKRQVRHLPGNMYARVVEAG